MRSKLGTNIDAELSWSTKGRYKCKIVPGHVRDAGNLEKLTVSFTIPMYSFVVERKANGKSLLEIGAQTFRNYLEIRLFL